jgi:hypothetical protein
MIQGPAICVCGPETYKKMKTRMLAIGLLALFLASACAAQDATARKQFAEEVLKKTVEQRGSAYSGYNLTAEGPDATLYVYHAPGITSDICRGLAEGVAEKLRTMGFTQVVCTGDGGTRFTFDLIAQKQTQQFPSLSNAHPLPALPVDITPVRQQDRPRADSKWTLGDFRREYLGQRILILQGNNVSGFLGGWEPYQRSADGSFHADFSAGAFVSYQYKDQTPTVIAIQQSDVGGSLKQRQENAMGESLSDDDVVNPSVDVFVRFDDGQIARYSNIVSNIRDYYKPHSDQDWWEKDRWGKEFMLVSDRDAHAGMINRDLPNAVGQKLYAVHDSLLFGPDITSDNLVSQLGTRESKRISDLPLLVPMTVIAAKYNERYDFIAWKLQLPDGRQIISAARYRDDGVGKNGNDNSFLERSIGTLLLKIPSSLTSQEITAIRERKIFRGMSRKAVFYSWGFTGENNWGRGGYQLEYGGGQFVYLDSSGRVTDWQSVGN